MINHACPYQVRLPTYDFGFKYLELCGGAATRLSRFMLSSDVCIAEASVLCFATLFSLSLSMCLGRVCLYSCHRPDGIEHGDDVSDDGNNICASSSRLWTRQSPLIRTGKI